MTNSLKPHLLAVLALGVAAFTASADVRQGLVAFWPMDAITDNTPDVVYTNNLSVLNMDTSSLVTGVHGQALSFNGVNQALSIVTAENNFDAGLPIYSAKKYTIAFWVNGAPGQVSRVMAGAGVSGTTSAPSSALLLINTPPDGSAKVSVAVRDTQGVVHLNNMMSTATVLDGQWHHVAWVDNNGQGTLYIDGNLDATTNYVPGNLLLNTTVVGGLLANNDFAGSIDDVGMWERALTQSEVQDAMTNGIQTPVPAFAPGVTQDPVSVATTVGDRAKFSILPNGTRPLTLQWIKDGNPISGATGSQLSLFNVSAADAGQYAVIVGNAATSVTSASATLTVSNDPPPNVSSGLLSYWPLDSATNSTTPDVHLGADMILHNIADSDFVAGQYSNCINFTGFSTYANRSKGSSIYNTNAYTVAFWVNGYAGEASGEVFSEGSSTDGNPLFMLGSPVSSSTPGYLDVFLRDSSGTYRLNHILSTNIVFDNNWHHVAWVDVNGVGKLYIDGALDPAVFTYTPGPAAFNTTALGGILRTAPGNYFFGDIDDVAVWNRPLTLTEIQQVKNSGVGQFVTPAAPIITAQPSGATMIVGQDYTFSVQAVGSVPLAYQWYHNSSAIANGTNSALALVNLQPGDAGGYNVTVTNASGRATSQTVSLIVNPGSIPNIANITNGLVAYWPMDIVTNGTTPDVVASNDLTLVNMVDTNLVTGVRGSSFFFSGASQYLKRVYTATPSVGLPIYTNPVYSIAMWVKGASGQNAHEVFSEANTTNATPLFMIGTPTTAGGSAADLFIRNSANVSVVSHKVSSASAFDGSWHHIALVDSNGTVAMYIDGVAQTNNFNYTKAALNANDTIIGAILRTSAASFFVGQIDEVAVWSRALQPSEVQFVMANSPNSPGLAIGNIANSSNSTVQLTIQTPHTDWQHVVQSSSTIAPTSWTDVSGLSFAQSGPNALQTSVPIDASPTEFYRVMSLIPNAFFYDNLETPNPQWSHSGTGDTWTIGNPVIGPQTAHSGTNCWATSLTTPYGPNTSVHLRTPAVDLTSAQHAWLVFSEFRDIQGLVSSQVVDSATVNILDANDPNGAPLVTLVQNVGSESGWTKRLFPLTAPVLGKSVIVEFVFTSGSSQSGIHAGWFIDDVGVVAQPF
jgi:hypothetical protein